MTAKTRWGWTLVLAGLLAACPAGAVRGQQAPGGRGATDAKMGNQRLYDALRDVINRGADLFNSGDQNGCYRLFQGALMMSAPQLDQYPDLQKAIQAGLADAERQGSIGARAFALRRLLDDARARVNPSPKKPAETKPTDTKPAETKPKPTDTRPKPTDTKPISPDTKPKPTDTKPPADTKTNAASTLWERLGGEANVKRVVDDFVDLATKDPRVDFTRGGTYKIDEAAMARLKKELVDYISQATGGTYKYGGKSMKEEHKGMHITDAQFDASVADLKKALEKNGAKPADVDTILRAVEATRKDIVEAKKPADAKPDSKKPETQKSSDKEPSDKP